MEISRRNLPLNALRAFEVAARHCHLRRAAEELGVTHGAVSRQIRQLEEQLGVALFDRSGNRLQLTQEGSRLARAVGEALDTLTEGALSVNPESLPGELVATLPVANNLPWIAALTANLPVAAGVYVISRIFDKQMSRISSLVYGIDGSWNEPQVTFSRVFDDVPDYVSDGAKQASTTRHPSRSSVRRNIPRDSSSSSTTNAASVSLPLR